MRCVQPAEYLQQGGWNSRVGCIYRTLPINVDVIVFHRVVFDQITQAYIAYAKTIGATTVYDIDDLLFEDDYRNTVENVISAMKRCDVVTVSTSFLKKRAQLYHHDVRQINNGLSDSFVDYANSFYRRSHSNIHNTVTVGYLSGSKHHDDDFRIVEHALIKLLDNYPNVSVLVMGKINYSQKYNKYNSRLNYKEFVTYEEFKKIFSQLDINIVPLDITSAFSQARSELKYIEASAFGIPTIASPTETYCQAIVNGDNGLLCSFGEWYDKLSFLVSNPCERKRIGEAARKDVLKNYTSVQRVKEWNLLMSSICADITQKKKRQRAPVIGYLELVYLLFVKRLRIIKRYFSNAFSLNT